MSRKSRPSQNVQGPVCEKLEVRLFLSAQPLLVNAGFESGASSWNKSGDFYAGTNLSNPRTGVGYAAGGVNTSGAAKDNASGAIYQQFTIPSNATSVTASWYRHISTAETTTSAKFDHMFARLLNTNNVVISILRDYTNLDKGTGYVRDSFNLLAYAGQTLRLQFFATSDSTLPTTFRLDDVSVVAEVPAIDTTKPTITKMTASPTSRTLGDPFTISYTVADTGGSGLNRVELWRAPDNNGAPGTWSEIKRTTLSGNGPVSGSFTDAPASTGVFWYGIHAVDNSGNWAAEPSSLGPDKVTVTPKMPNLTPYKPSGWSDKIVVSAGTGTRTDNSPLYSNHDLYVDWAVVNNGTANAGATFYTKLYVDGVFKKEWYTNSLTAGFMTTGSDYNIGKLSAGTHTIKIVTDTSGKIAESNETDNAYTKTIAVSTPKPNLTPYKPSTWSDKIVVSTGTGTSTDNSTLFSNQDLYVDWAVINNGAANAATKFYTKLYIDGVLKQTWSNGSLTAGSWTRASDYNIGKLSAGTHTIKIVTDANKNIAESSETDNEYTKTITVSAPGFNPALVGPNQDAYTNHMGADYSRWQPDTGTHLGEGTPIVSPVTGIVRYIEGDHGYGTMAVWVEVTLPSARTFTSEYSGFSVTTDRVMVLFGHLRPSATFYAGSTGQDRLNAGLHELGYNVGDTVIAGQTILGYLERNDSAGDSSAPHLHISVYDLNQTDLNLNFNRYAGASEPTDPIRKKYIRPELAWLLLS